nr:MAG TPA: hypothetical protein [Caudoviricetes sp.]
MPEGTRHGAEGLRVGLGVHPGHIAGVALHSGSGSGRHFGHTQTRQTPQLVTILRSTQRELRDAAVGQGRIEVGVFFILPVVGGEVPRDTHGARLDVHTLEVLVGGGHFEVDGLDPGPQRDPVEQDGVADGGNFLQRGTHPVVAVGIRQIGHQGEMKVEITLPVSSVGMRVIRGREGRMGGTERRFEFGPVTTTEPPLEIRRTASEHIDVSHCLGLLVDRVESPVAHREGVRVDDFGAPGHEILVTDTEAVGVAGVQPCFQDIGSIRRGFLVPRKDEEAEVAGLVAHHGDVDGFDDREAHERVVPHAGHDTAAVATVQTVAVVGHGEIGAELRRHDDVHLAFHPAFGLDEDTLEVSQDLGKILRRHMHGLAGLAQIHILIHTGEVEARARGHFGHHAAQDESTHGAHIRLVHGFQQLFFIAGPTLAGHLDVGGVELDVLIAHVADAQTTGLSADSVGHELLVLLVRTQRTDLRRVHELDGLVAPGHRFQKFGRRDTRQPVVFIHARQDEIAVADTGERGGLDAGVSTRTGENRHGKAP